MKYWLDTEFIEAGRHKPLILISIGIVSENDRTLYLVSSEFRDQDCNDWVKANVLPHLGSFPRCSVDSIAQAIREFIGEDNPEFWGYYADYDWVVFCQLFGSMIDLPKGWPMYCRDLKQLCDSKGNPKLPKQQSTEHNALSDAQWNRVAHEFLNALTRQ